MERFQFKRRLQRGALTAAIASACFGTGVVAADTARAPMIQAGAQLLDAKVVNRQGEELGEIEELVLNPDGSMRYVILARGGVLDIGEDLVAVPWDRTQLQIEDDHVVMALSKAQLATAPTFERKAWPDMHSEAWNAKVRTFSEAFVARENPTPPGEAMGFDRLDQNRDGHLSTQETALQPSLRAQFEDLDRNQDGSLSRWEFNAFEPPATMAARTGSPSEKIRASLSPEERERRDRIARSSQQQNVTDDAATQSLSSKGGGNTGKSAKETPPHTAESGSNRFKQLDADGDGNLNQAEVEADPALQKRFTQLDRDGDGRLDEAEFSAFETPGETQDQTGPAGASAPQSRNANSPSQP